MVAIAVAAPPSRGSERMRSFVHSGWTRLIVRRVIFVPITLWLVVTLTFFVTRLLGGNPAVKLAGPNPTRAAIAGIDAQLGLDKPLGAQYWTFLSGAVHGNFGTSFLTGQSVGAEILQKAPGTIELVVFGTALATLIGIGLALVAVRRPGSVVDRIAKALSILAFATPDFFLGGVLALVFAFTLKIFPVPAGQLPFSIQTPRAVTNSVLLDSLLEGNWAALSAHIELLVLPCVTLGLIYFASIFKVTRGALATISRQEFMVYADAVGLSARFRRRYAMRHSMTLVVTYVGLTTATLLGGAVLVEQVYSWGGLGSYGVQAIQNNDYPAVQGFVVALGALAVLIYFIVDILYAVIDPRVRL
jgi:ABC-type dipeptide/oligopeptide/nickel transport system permease component